MKYSFKFIQRMLQASLCLAAVSAQAAGIYDGIYQNPTDSNNYLSVHQNGKTLIVASFNTVKANGSLQSSTAGVLVPTQQNIWDLFSGGPVDSIGSAAINGTLAYGACSGTMNLVFGSAEVVVTVTNIVNTALGTKYGVDCRQVIIQPPMFGLFKKVF